MFRIPSFWGIWEIKETGVPKGSEVIQEWDGFRVSEESEKPSFRNVPRLFQEQDEIRVSGFPRKPRFRRVSEVILGMSLHKVSLAFLQDELAIYSEFVCDIHLWVSTGFRLVVVFVSGTGFRFGRRQSRFSILVRVQVWLACFLGFLVRIWDCRRFSGELRTTFPMAFVYLLHEIPKVV